MDLKDSCSLAEKLFVDEINAIKLLAGKTKVTVI